MIIGGYKQQGCQVARTHDSHACAFVGANTTTAYIVEALLNVSQHAKGEMALKTPTGVEMGAG